MSKVRLESFLWGAGTALGELPPYFMARAARLSGYDPEDAEDLQQFEELQKKRALGEKLNLFEKLKLGMERIVERIGFLGILACASVSSITSCLSQSCISTFSCLVDSKSTVWSGRHHLRSLLSAILDILWCNAHREGNYQNAPAESRRDRSFQRTVGRQGCWLD